MAGVKQTDGEDARCHHKAGTDCDGDPGTKAHRLILGESPEARGLPDANVFDMRVLMCSTTIGHRIALMLRRLCAFGWLAIAGGVALWTPTSARAADSHMVIAVIGDYGSCAYSCTNEQAVANLVHRWGPDVIMTVGDNSYENGTATEVPKDQLPYAADVLAGRFYQVTGNHDWGNTCNVQAIAPSTSYFGRPPHYTAHLGRGLVDLFATDMNCGDPAGDSATSAQAAWYRGEVAASTAIWRITADHQAFYSSGEHGTQRYTHWAILPSIDLFLSGHDHDFEHLIEGGQPFVVDGVGGRNLYPIGAPIAGSVWHDASHFGAVRLTVTPATLTVEFINLAGTTEHAFTLSKTGQPVAGAQTGSASKPAATATPAAVTQPSPQPSPTASLGPLVANTAQPPQPIQARMRISVLDAVLLGPPLLILIGASTLLYRRLGHR